MVIVHGQDLECGSRLRRQFERRFTALSDANAARSDGTPDIGALGQRLRDGLGQRRTILGAGDGNLTGIQPSLLLRIELEEFSHLFAAPAQSVGLVRLRATLVQSTAGVERLLGQRMVVAQRAAATADAPGGVRALTEATDSAVQEIEQWLSQWR